MSFIAQKVFVQVTHFYNESQCNFRISWNTIVRVICDIANCNNAQDPALAPNALSSSRRLTRYVTALKWIMTRSRVCGCDWASNLEDCGFSLCFPHVPHGKFHFACYDWICTFRFIVTNKIASVTENSVSRNRSHYRECAE